MLVCCCALALALASRAAAHGAPPVATELLVCAQQACLVRLAPGGLAHRAEGGFRFVCPESWGGDVLAPAAALTQGPVLLASDQLSVVAADGQVSTHPVQSGVGSVVTSAGEAVYGVFRNDTRWELRRLTASTNELVRVLEQPVAALRADERGLVLLGWVESTFVLQRLSLAGDTLASVTWQAPHVVTSAHLRSAAGELYVVAFGRSSPWVTLGRVTDSRYEPLREASVDIAGPIAGAVDILIALDGKLQSLQTDAAVPTDSRVTCLGESDGEPYACAHGDLVRVDERGLGAPLFELSSLLAPDYAALDELARADCTTRWVDLRADVAAARPGVDDAGVRDAAVVGPVDASVQDAAAVPAASCSARPLGTRPAGLPSGLLLFCALCLPRRRLSRRRFVSDCEQHTVR